MAKKSNSISNASLLSTLAFWGLFFSALIFVVVGAIRLFGITAGTLVGILEIVAKVLLLIAVAIPAYGYVDGKKKAWKIVYWVALVIYALGVVFGVIGYIK